MMQHAKKVACAVTICGPSGVGKGTLLKRLFAAHADRLSYCISHTSRASRPGELDGREYHFSTREEMQKLDAAGGFLEMCSVHGNLYGTSVAAVKEVQDTGKICIVEVDVQGAQKLLQRKSSFDMTSIFVTAPMEALGRRIRHRGSVSEEEVGRRLDTAKDELEFLDEHKGFFDHVVHNDDVDVAYADLVTAINSELEKRGVAQLEEA